MVQKKVRAYNLCLNWSRIRLPTGTWFSWNAQLWRTISRRQNHKNTRVAVYQRVFLRRKTIYRVVERVSIPPQHGTIAPGTISGSKAQPVAKVVLFEPDECFINNENQISKHALYILETGKVLIAIANTDYEVLTTYKETTMGPNQLVSDRLTQELYKIQVKEYNGADPEYDLEKVKKQ